MRELTLASGASLPVFGVGTWRMGEHDDHFDAEVAVLREALEQGVRLIDTAEMYGEGGAEEVIGEAIRGRRDGLYLVSKFYPYNASRRGVVEACERSLRRMDCDFIDLYLLHWPGSIPLQETFDALLSLQESGKIRDFGVSNFDLGNLEAIPTELQARLGCNQVFYNLVHREAEWAVSGWCRQRNVPLMAYSPLDQGGALLRSPVLEEIADKHQATPAQIALAWLLHQPGTVVIPKTSNSRRVAENLGAVDVVLDAADLEALDSAFPAPQSPVRLGMR